MDHCIVLTPTQIEMITDYGHTMAKSLILCGPNSNPNPKHQTKMVADKSVENTPYAQKLICPNCLPKLSAQVQKFGILMKKGVKGLL